MLFIIHYTSKQKHRYKISRELNKNFWIPQEMYITHILLGVLRWMKIQEYMNISSLRKVDFKFSKMFPWLSFYADSLKFEH